jgi:ribosomal protein S18 acetylase RimI-like enzyme
MNIDEFLIRRAILGNNLLWRCVFTDELVVTPEYDLVYTFGVDAKFMSSAQRINIKPENLENELTKIESFYKTRNKPSVIQLDPVSSPQNLKEILIDRGYSEEKKEEEIWWGIDLNQPYNSYKITNDLVIKACETRELYEDHIKAAMKGYENFKFWASLISKSFRKSVDGVNVFHWVAYLGTEPVACASLGMYFDIAFLINVTVVPEHRKKGIHTSLMTYRLNEARRLGAKYAFYQTDFDNEASIATGRKVGFEEIFRRYIYFKQV